MPRRHALAACAALATVGALALAGPASAQPDPVSAAPSAADTLQVDRTSPAVLDAMSRDLGLTRAQAADRLVNEAEAGATSGRLRAALGGDFAGAWVSGADSGRLTVATTDPADVRTITAQGAQAEVVRHTLSGLDAAKASLDKAARTTDTRDAPVWYVDVRSNSVVVEALSEQAGEKLLAAAGVDTAMARVDATTQRPRALYDLRGGDAYYMNGSGRCSVGFPITRNGQQGFATAGHCGRPGTTTSGYNRVAQGTFQASTFPGRDMAWVAANSQWTSTPYVKGRGGVNVQVTGSTQQPVGASICRSGSTTGWHCGTIQQHNTSVTYPEGTISGVTRTSVCAEPGDSGGSYISGSQAQGVTSGGSGNCSSGGTTFHQPINPLLQTYGLTLKTSTGGTDPGEPGEPGGTWAAGGVYEAGATVTYGGTTYRCLQAHQAQAGWEPPNAPSLWQRV
ncbi:alpha-lytic protease prodomain-containing protein [Streptomyces sp. B-S-A8]|uniref:Alpha-lytic protease prodomain-containing protein n=1 Tax=Streptomyces solicavernae TaxID=3043614 RepID=A0ABT6RP89_9ACTN|nr:alpha-lytic protease prodomain-containing protein [Streptomyces sp. B-S-A8]MDI3386212.1 alpha-lytic protease prodomain-containing protein [Streptomyces sp. B-S-A8]